MGKDNIRSYIKKNGRSGDRGKLGRSLAKAPTQYHIPIEIITGNLFKSQSGLLLSFPTITVLIPVLSP